jgi:hypothetical protein
LENTPPPRGEIYQPMSFGGKNKESGKKKKERGKKKRKLKVKG